MTSHLSRCKRVVLDAIPSDKWCNWLRIYFAYTEEFGTGPYMSDAIDRSIRRTINALIDDNLVDWKILDVGGVPGRVYRRTTILDQLSRIDAERD